MFFHVFFKTSQLFPSRTLIFDLFHIELVKRWGFLQVPQSNDLGSSVFAKTSLVLDKALQRTAPTHSSLKLSRFHLSWLPCSWLPATCPWLFSMFSLTLSWLKLFECVQLRETRGNDLCSVHTLPLPLLHVMSSVTIISHHFEWIVLSTSILWKCVGTCYSQPKTPDFWNPRVCGVDIPITKGYSLYTVLN